MLGTLPLAKFLANQISQYIFSNEGAALFSFISPAAPLSRGHQTESTVSLASGPAVSYPSRDIKTASPAPRAGRFYRPELDALRFFAFLCVFCHHIYFFLPGWFQPISAFGAFGVCVFFLLSAYLIVTILLREQEATGTVRIGAFAARRVLRIWPLYFVVVAFGYLLGQHWHGAYISRHAVLALLFLAGNIYIATGRSWQSLGAISPLWSISVEEQFYLLVPLLTRFGGRRGLNLICWFALAGSYLTLVWMGVHGVSHFWDRVWPNSLVQFQFFAAGGIIALVHYGRKVQLKSWQRIICLLGGLFAWRLAVRGFPAKVSGIQSTQHLIAVFLLMLAGAVAIFYSFLGFKAKIPGTFVYLGQISYGLYVFHGIYVWMIFENERGMPATRYFTNRPVMGCALALGATVATAAVSYHFFERPILRLKRKFEVIRTREA